MSEEVRVNITAESSGLDAQTKAAAASVTDFGQKVQVSAKQFQQALQAAGGDGQKALENIAKGFSQTQATVSASVQKMVAGDLGLQGMTNGLARFQTASIQAGTNARTLGAHLLGAGESAAVAHQRVLMFGRDLASGNFEQAGLAVADVGLRLAEVSAIAGVAVLGIGLVTAGIGYMAYRNVAARESIDNIGYAMSQMGRGAQFSEEKITRMARSMSKDFIAYEGDVKRVLLAVEQIPQATETTMTKLTALTLVIARATNREPIDVAKEFVEVFRSGAGGLQQFAEKVNLLSGSQKLEVEQAVKVNDALKVQGIVIDALIKRYEPWFVWVEKLSKSMSAFGMGIRGFTKYILDTPERFRAPQLQSGNEEGQGKQSDTAKALALTKSVTSDLEKRKEILNQIQAAQRGIVGANAEEANILRSRIAKLREEYSNIGKNQMGAINAASALEMEEYKKNLEMRVQIAREHYERIAKMRGANSQEAIDAQRKLLEAERALSDQQVALQKINQDMKRDERLFEVQMEEDRLAAARQNGSISSREEAERLLALNQQKLQIETDFLMQIRQLYQEDAVQQRQIDQQILRMRLASRRREAEIERGAMSDYRQMWSGAWSTLQSSATNSIMGILNGTMTMGQAVQNILMNTASSVIGSLIQMGFQWLATQLGIDRILGLSSKVNAAAEIANNAAVAGAAGTASAAAIPVVGWTIAPAAGEATFASAMSYMGMLAVPSAREGWDVNRDALTMVHEEEMILPAEQANAVRNMAKGGRGAGAQINISAVDARSIRRLFEQHGASIARSLRMQRRNFNSSLGMA